MYMNGTKEKLCSSVFLYKMKFKIMEFQLCVCVGFFSVLLCEHVSLHGF